MREALRRAPVVALLGGPGVGKTTLARHIAGQARSAVYVDAALHSGRTRLERGEILLRAHARQLVVLDGVERVPGGPPARPALVGVDPNPGRFLLVGSISPARFARASGLTAGHLECVELPPLWIGELEPEPSALERLWLRGGLPESLLAASDSDSAAWRERFVQDYLERAKSRLGLRAPAETLRRFLAALARNHGEPWNGARIARGLGVARLTVQRWLHVFADACLVRRLPAFEVDAGKRIVKTDKVYVRDSGVLHALLEIADRRVLLGHVAVVTSFQGFAIEQILASAHGRVAAAPAFYRTHHGAELDLVLSLRRGRGERRLGIQAWNFASPPLTRGLHDALRDTACDEGFVVIPAGEVYRVGEHVSVVPLAELAAGEGLLGLGARYPRPRSRRRPSDE